MTKWALMTVTGFLGCISGFAQQPLLLPLSARTNVASNFTELKGGPYGFSSLTLLNGRFVDLASAYSWIEPEYLPLLDLDGPANAAHASHAEGNATATAESKPIEAKPRLIDQVHGEVGFLYGHSAGGGRFNGDVEQGYILGEITTGKTDISVGASFERSNFHFSRH